MKITQRLIVTTSQSASLLRNVLIGTTISLSFGLIACSPADVAIPSGPETTTEATASEDGITGNTAAATPKVYAKDGVAIGGADPVAYFTQETFVSGSADYTHEWQGVSWQFASAENRDAFARDPEQYAPQYGGHCAWAVAAKNTLVPIDPNAWRIVDGKLYLNANKRVQGTWEKDIPGFIAQADSNWPVLAVQ